MKISILNAWVPSKLRFDLAARIRMTAQISEWNDLRVHFHLAQRIVPSPGKPNERMSE